jgi:hypothetical protein
MKMCPRAQPGRRLLQGNPPRRSFGLTTFRGDVWRESPWSSPHAPIAGKGLPAGSTEHCTLCDRSVHNLDLMNERERREFMGCLQRQGVCCVHRSGLPAARIPVRHRGLGVAALAAGRNSGPARGRRFILREFRSAQ